MRSALPSEVSRRFSWSLLLLSLLHIYIWSVGVIEAPAKDFFVAETTSLKSGLAPSTLQNIREDHLSYCSEPEELPDQDQEKYSRLVFLRTHSPSQQLALSQFRLAFSSNFLPPNELASSSDSEEPASSDSSASVVVF